MTNEGLKVWLIEDNEGYAFLLQEFLVTLGFSSKDIFVFPSLQEVREIPAEFTPDVILLDLFLTDSFGIETFRTMNTLYGNVPIIVMSGLSDTEIALETLKEGAQDYLVKGEYSTEMMEKSIQYSIERKRNVDEITLSEQKYRSLFQTSPLPVFIIRKDMEILDANTAATALYGLNTEALPNYTTFFAEAEIAERAKDAMLHQVSKQFRQQSTDGKELFVEQISKLADYKNEEAYIVIIKDETEKRHFEQEKMRLIHETQEDERARFSRELHDGLAQYLVAVNLYLEQLNGISAEKDTVVGGIRDLVKTSLDMARTMSYNLSPPELEKGLISGLEAFFQRLARIAKIEFSIVRDPELEDKHMLELDEYAIYRIIQEFVNNSIKHSACTSIETTFYPEENNVVIEIRDNGVGFDIDEVYKGLGLKNMEQRAQASGMTVDLQSRPGKGTWLTITSPINR
jgi:two-component system sensor histidine kinase UhpB